MGETNTPQEILHSVGSAFSVITGYLPSLSLTSSGNTSPTSTTTTQRNGKVVDPEDLLLKEPSPEPFLTYPVDFSKAYRQSVDMLPRNTGPSLVGRPYLRNIRRKAPSRVGRRPLANGFQRQARSELNCAHYER